MREQVLANENLYIIFYENKTSVSLSILRMIGSR